MPFIMLMFIDCLKVRVLVDNATQLIKEVPDQVNSLVSKHAPVTMEADMKHCNLANKIASENSGFEILRNIYCRPSDPRY